MQFTCDLRTPRIGCFIHATNPVFMSMICCILVPFIALRAQGGDYVVSDANFRTGVTKGETDRIRPEFRGWRRCERSAARLLTPLRNVTILTSRWIPLYAAALDRRSGPFSPQRRTISFSHDSIMKKIRLGFIGTGNMGQMAHLRNYMTLPNCEVVAMAELRPQLAAQVAARWGIPEVYHDADELLAKAKVDAYVMIQPFWIHGGLIPAVLAKGKPLMIEKPLAHSVEIAEKLAQLSKKHKAP